MLPALEATKIGGTSRLSAAEKAAAIPHTPKMPAECPATFSLLSVERFAVGGAWAGLER
jgi:hypothetical protein